MSETYKVKNETWDVIYEGLPEIPTKDRNKTPIPEILRVIEYCLDDRVEHYDIAFTLAKDILKLNSDIQVVNWYAATCFTAKKFKESYEACKKILPYAENDFNFLVSFAKSANRCNLVDEAISITEKAYSLEGITEEQKNSVLIDLVVYYSNKGDLKNSNRIFETINKDMLSNMDKKVHRFNSGCYFLHEKKDFKEGMKALCSGREMGVWGHDHTKKFNCPKWDGKTYPGKTILIVGEAGLGDEIISWRFAKLIKERGMNVVYSTVRKDNINVVKRIPGFDNAYEENVIKNLKIYDYWAPCMDLPMILGLSDTDIDNKPYLTADEKYVDKWSKIIPKKEGRYRVGIRWAGNALYEDELLRTIPVEKFDDLISNSPDNVDFYSLQRDDGTDDMYKMTNFSKLTPLNNQLENFEDALGAIANLDLVITSCTSIAHMSAAMGVPTWIGTIQFPYYIWLCKDNTWYESVKHYRKPIYNDWDTPFNDIKRDLPIFINNLEKEEKN